MAVITLTPNEGLALREVTGPAAAPRRPCVHHRPSRVRLRARGFLYSRAYA